MLKCINGHESSLGLKCGTCGGAILYKNACSELFNIPSIEVNFEQISVLYVGFPSSLFPNAFVAQLLMGVKEDVEVGSFVVERLEGGTWLDFQTMYLKKFERWLTLVGFRKSRYRLMIVDTMNPLSVLALRALPTGDNTIILAIIADPDSTPLEQHTSYVSLTVASQRSFPMILLTSHFREQVAFFAEREGFVMGDRALGEVISFLLNSVADLIDFVQRDSRLGIRVHAFSSLMAASDRVYRTVDDAFLVQGYHTSMDLELEEVHTAYLLATAGKSMDGSIIQGFRQYCSHNLVNLVSTEQRIYENENKYGLYNLFILYGLKNIPIFTELKKAYKNIVSRAKDLKVEEIV